MQVVYFEKEKKYILTYNGPKRQHLAPYLKENPG